MSKTSARIACVNCGSHLLNITSAMIKKCSKEGGYRALMEQIIQRRAKGRDKEWVRGGFCKYCKWPFYSHGHLQQIQIPRESNPEVAFPPERVNPEDDAC